MADDKSEGDLKAKGTKEETAENESKNKQETQSSRLMHSAQISSQFTSPLCKRTSSESDQTGQNVRSKRVKYNCEERQTSKLPLKKQDEETKELETILRKKKNILRKLKLVKMYRAKNNLDDLEVLIAKWRSICQQAAQDLYEKFSHEKSPRMGQFLDGLRVNHELIRYCEDDETFY